MGVASKGSSSARGFVENREFRCLIRDSGFRDRAGFIDTDWDFPIRVINGHLHPGPERGLYDASFEAARVYSFRLTDF